MFLSIRTRLLSAALIVLAAPAWSLDNFSSMYKGAGTSGGSCGNNYSITGAEPSTGGSYPVFVYMVGTTETYDNASAMAAVNSMAAKGYVAATIQYASGSFGGCSTISAKTSCVFNPASQTSAISQLCQRSKADCSKGVVVAGFSQGSVMAILAKNYEPRVQAAFGMGAGVKYSIYDLSSCVANGKRILSSDHLRTINGEKDFFMGSNQSSVRNQLQTLTGLNCGTSATGCINTGNNSGWGIVLNTQVGDGSADHCYMRDGSCLGSENKLDSKWLTGSDNWALEPNLQWLTTFTKK